jgi:hypothetical protein
VRIKIHQSQKQSVDEQQNSKPNLERHNLILDLHLLPLVGAELCKCPLHEKQYNQSTISSRETLQDTRGQDRKKKIEASEWTGASGRRFFFRKIRYRISLI